jgi:hypothetical protein
MPVCLPDGSIAYPAKADYKAIGSQQSAADFNAALSGGWRFNAGEMSVFLKSLDDEADRLRTMSNRAEVLSQVEPAGGDIASKQSADAVNNSGALCQASIASALNYLTSYRDHNRQVQKAYLDQDEAALEVLRGTRKDA